MTINNMIKEIEELHKGTVYYFGEEHTLSECDEMTINVIDILEALKDYEIECSIEELAEYGAIADVYNYRGDNTYNWNAPINHHMDFRVYNEKGGTFVELAVHRFGDVRGNYTDYTVLQFDNDYEFYEALTECNKYISVEVGGETYDCHISVMSECVEVYNSDGDYICEAYGDIDDIKAEIVGALQ